jgi:hypothetical protein
MPDRPALHRLGGVAKNVLLAWRARVCSYREDAP